MRRFECSPGHANALQLIDGLVHLRQVLDPEVFDEVEDRVLTNQHAELTAFVIRDDYKFLRTASLSHRAVSKRLLRKIVARAFPEYSRMPELRSNRFGPSQLNEFGARGVATFGQYIDEDQRKSILNHLADKPVYNAHIAACSDQIPRRIGDRKDPAEAYQFGSYAEDDVARLPSLSPMVLNSALLNFLKNYFGVSPVLRDLHLWWSFPQPSRFGPHPFAGQGTHRDFRSVQDVQFFVCLSDMDDADGAHEYFAGTHDDHVFARQLQSYAGLRDLPANEALQRVFFPAGDGYGQDADWAGMLGDSMTRVPIRAGHCFLIDTMGLHRGVAPQKSWRLVFSARFSASGAESAVFARTHGGMGVDSELSYTLSAIRDKWDNRSPL